ncbi:conjugal transfer protein TraG, partial [Streptococcus suis]
MTIKRKPFLPYFLLGVLLAFCCHRAYVLYALAPAPSMTEPFSPYVYVLDHYIEAPYFYSDHSPLALLFALIGFLIGMLAYLKIKPDGTYRHG